MKKYIQNEEDLYEAELLNYFSLCTQIQNFFKLHTLDFLPSNKRSVVDDFINKNNSGLERLKHSMTITASSFPFDDVANEILTNLGDIIAQRLNHYLKTKCFLMSFNRLVKYKTANIENLKILDTSTNFLIMQRISKQTILYY